MFDLRELPLFVYLLLSVSLLMFVPALYALSLGQTHTASVFGFNGLVMVTIVVTISLAIINRKPKSSGRLHLITLLVSYLVLPLVATLPFSNLTPQISFSQAYFEMMSCLTTTGSSMFPDPSDISRPLHLWRSCVAWFGGFMIIAAAASIMEPMNLGGFEIRSAGRDQSKLNVIAKGASSASDRVIRAVRRIAPIYIGMSMILAAALAFFGDDPFIAATHAMAIVSTSGVSPVGGLQGATSGIMGEVIIAVFLMAAVSRQVFAPAKQDRVKTLMDREVRVAIVLIVASTVLLLLYRYTHHTGNVGQTPLDVLRIVWASAFTAFSFLTTSGFASHAWVATDPLVQQDAEGMMFLILAFLGGGIATTAGGVKLLRVYVLFKHGERELARLVHPHSVAGSGADARYIRREGAYITWMFVMLFMLSIAAIALALSLCGLSFTSAFVLAIASISNTGPLPTLFGSGIENYADLSDNMRMFLDISMIIGRMEILAVVALLNTALWRF